jgi:hypothetical protein
MSFRRSIALAPLLASFGWGLHASGCAAIEEKRFAASSASGTSSGGGGAGGTGGDSAPSGGQGGGLNPIESSGQGGLDPDGSCASTSAEADLLPLDMLILLDRSGSMLGSKWIGATTAISTFVNDAASVGMNVGLTYFPRGQAGQNDCEHETYEELSVLVGELPLNSPAITASIQTTSPNGGTPMRPALEGVLYNATAYQDANPTHKVVVVLATDGDPSGCSNNTIPRTASLAASALNYNGVQTYVIAVEGSTLANLNQIAAAGGSAQAYDISSDIAAFSAKMAEIRAAALPCELLIPEPPTGESLDKDKVAVRWTPGMGVGMEVEIPKAEDVADCGATPGWYYDNNSDPGKIVLCPASCAAVQDDRRAKINILFGCRPDLK